MRSAWDTGIILGTVACGLGVAALLAAPPVFATQVQTAPTAYPVTDASGTINNGGTFQAVFAQAVGRHDCTIENPTTASEDLYIHADAGSPTTGNSFSIGKGGVFNCQAFGIVTPDTVQVEGATTGHAFVAKTQ